MDIPVRNARGSYHYMSHLRVNTCLFGIMNTNQYKRYIHKGEIQNKMYSETDLKESGLSFISQFGCNCNVRYKKNIAISNQIENKA